MTDKNLEALPEDPILFSHPMPDSVFVMEKVGTSVYMKEVMRDGTVVFTESICNWNRILTILERIRAN